VRKIVWIGAVGVVGLAAVATVLLREKGGARGAPVPPAQLRLARSGPLETEEGEAMFPYATYLAAEAQHARQQAQESREMFQRVVDWAASDPLKDGWGASSLAAFALWRELSVERNAAQAREDAGRLLDALEKVKNTRFYRRLAEDPVLPRMPRLEEDIVRKAASLAWAAGRREDGTRLFLEYLSLASTAQLTGLEQDMMRQLVADGLASEDRLALLRGKRLFSALRLEADAAPLLKAAGNSRDPQVRAEAGLYLARLQLNRGTPRAAVAAEMAGVIEDTSDPRVLQRALLDRYRMLSREGPDQNLEEAVDDLKSLAQETPRTALTDEGMYELARYYQNVGDLEKALPFYSRLRELPQPNAFRERAYFQPALAMHFSGAAGGAKEAERLLNELRRMDPPAELRPHALFWLARIAEGRGDAEEARKLFRELAGEIPYHYYAIRARMHLHDGPQASRQLWPGEAVKEELSKAASGEAPTASAEERGPYHQRLRVAVESRLYADALSTERRLRERFPGRRLEELSPEEVDSAGLLHLVAALLALRQDAWAASEVNQSPGNRLRVANLAGRGAGDWPVTVFLADSYGQPYAVRAATQREPSFPATACPRVYVQTVRTAGASHSVHPQLLYAIMRQESAFNAAALSPRNAFGLFQIMPGSFRELDRRWRLVGPGGTVSPQTYLLDPENSILLGARLFKEEFLSRRGGNELLALMEHNAGTRAVNEWVKQWREQQRSEDIEYLVETARFQETRSFVRSVYSSAVIAGAAGVFKDPGGETR
jgi:soluble lytic murein transglycosylase-like protein